MATNIEREQGLHVWNYEDIPQEVRDGSNQIEVDRFWDGIATGSKVVTNEALDKLLDNN